MTQNGITGVDHLLMPVRDLEETRMRWTRLGFILSPRGTHLGRGTGNYCVMFEHDYLELFGILDRSIAPEEFRAFLARREGPMKLAWAIADLDAATAALTALGLHPGPQRDLARQIELPDRTAVPRFSRVSLPVEETPGLDSFLCAHLTPELMRRREWLLHPNGALGLLGVTVLVADTRPLLPAYEQLFGPAAIQTTDAVLTVRAGRHRLIFAAPDDFAAMHPEIKAPAEAETPAIAVVTIRVRDIEATADHLTQWQVEFEKAGRHGVLVPAHAASGAALEFVASG